MPTGNLVDRRERAEATLRERWTRIGFDALYEAEQHYIAIYWLVGGVSNGGFHAYFFNSSGDLALLALQGLIAIHAPQSLRILERAMAVFPPGGYSTDREVRWRGLRMIAEDAEGEIAAFDEVSDLFQSCHEDIDGTALDRIAELYTTNGTWLEPHPIPPLSRSESAGEDLAR